MRPVALTAPALADWLAEQIAERTSGAVIRFGDGEEDVLMAGAGEAAAMRSAKWKLERQSGVEFTEKDVLTTGQTVRRAFDRADVLGILFGDGFNAGNANALTALHLNEVAAGRREPATLAGCHLHHAITDLLPRLLAEHSVSAISSRDLKPVLEGEWKLDDVAVYQVPSGGGERDLDGPYEAAMHDVPIWPNRLLELRSELEVREQGEVFLVGAGIFGKSICVDIKDKGGLALDLGSALDRIVGKVSRGPLRRVRLLRDEGLSPLEIAAALQDRHGVEFDADAIAALIQEEPIHCCGNPYDPHTVSRILKPVARPDKDCDQNRTLNVCPHDDIAGAG